MTTTSHSETGAVTGVPWEDERLRHLVSLPRNEVMGDDENVGVQVRTVRSEYGQLPPSSFSQGPGWATPTHPRHRARQASS